jgi:hypothetical protein
MHFLVVTDWHGPVVSDQHDEQYVAAAVVLKVPILQAKHVVDSLLEANVPF